eukprot:COSAG06_NODE_312_length_17767_cov_17.644895_7_plen_78_part_00
MQNDCDMIPLMVQSNFKPKGWLGLMMMMMMMMMMMVIVVMVMMVMVVVIIRSREVLVGFHFVMLKSSHRMASASSQG